MRSAEALIDREFAFVLGIPENEVHEYIERKLAQMH